MSSIDNNAYQNLPQSALQDKDPNICKIQRQRNVIADLIEQNAKLRAALLLIMEHKLPYKGFSTDLGSNGVRDHFINIANKALAETNG